MPLLQICPLAQTVPQPPQFWRSVCRSRQTPEQLVNPLAQVTEHTSPSTRCPLAQAVPQAPQLAVVGGEVAAHARAVGEARCRSSRRTGPRSTPARGAGAAAGAAVARSVWRSRQTPEQLVVPGAGDLTTRCPRSTPARWRRRGRTAAVGAVGGEVAADARAVVEPGAAAHDAGARGAHLPAAHAAAGAAVVAVGGRSRHTPAALGEPRRRTRRRRRPVGAHLPAGAGVAAGAAVVVVGVQVAADAAAVGEPRRRTTPGRCRWRRPARWRRRCRRRRSCARRSAGRGRSRCSSLSALRRRVWQAPRSRPARWRRRCRSAPQLVVVGGEVAAHARCSSLSPERSSRAQAPLEQTCPLAQDGPQRPQFARSLWRSRQTPLHSVRPVPHDTSQTRRWSTPARWRRRCRRRRSWRGRVWRSRQTPAHSVRPAARDHAGAAEQTCPRGTRCRTSRSGRGRPGVAADARAVGEAAAARHHAHARWCTPRRWRRRVPQARS
jgi:hypothetical protein